jgi:hypothetical protein
MVRMNRNPTRQQWKTLTLTGSALTLRLSEQSMRYAKAQPQSSPFGS